VIGQPAIREESKMDTSTPLTHRSATSQLDVVASKVNLPQYSRWAIVGIWAAAALPMGALAWLVAPALADQLSGPANVPLIKAVTIALTAGLIWQFLLVVILVAHEQRTLRWSTVRNALWLRAPRSPGNGRVGGRLWLVLVPLVAAYAAVGLLALGVGEPESRNLSAFLESDAGQGFFGGNWLWYAVTLLMMLFNTVLGEELLFRGFLLPRMNGAFGRGDWLANGVLFAAYHVHVPWVMPAALLDAFFLAYPTKRYRSAWIGIAVHSSQTLFFGIVLLTFVV
jgi:membrane protease YdiL (CAAX protease family)